MRLDNTRCVSPTQRVSLRSRLLARFGLEWSSDSEKNSHQLGWVRVTSDIAQLEAAQRCGQVRSMCPNVHIFTERLQKIRDRNAVKVTSARGLINWKRRVHDRSRGFRLSSAQRTNWGPRTMIPLQVNQRMYTPTPLT